MEAPFRLKMLSLYNECALEAQRPARGAQIKRTGLGEDRRQAIS